MQSLGGPQNPQATSGTSGQPGGLGGAGSSSMNVAAAGNNIASMNNGGAVYIEEE